MQRSTLGTVWEMKPAQESWKLCHGGMKMDALSSSHINKIEFQRRKQKKKEEKTHILNSPSGSVHLVINLLSLMKKHLHKKIIKDSEFNVM